MGAIPQSSNALSKVRCTEEVLSKVRPPVGMSEKFRKDIIQKVAIMKDKAIFEEGTLSDFCNILSKVTEIPQHVLKDLFNNALFNGYGRHTFEEGNHYILGKKGFIKKDGSVLRSWGVTLTETGKSRLFFIAINEGFKQKHMLATAYVDYQPYLIRLLNSKKDNRENIEAYFRNKNEKRESGKQLFMMNVEHLMDKHGMEVQKAKRKVQVNQKKHYQALCPGTTGAHSAAVLRANGENPDDMNKRRKIDRAGVANHLTVFGNAENNYLHAKALNMAMRHPELDYNECVSIVTKDAMNRKCCMHLEPDGSFVTDEEQERIIYNDSAWVTGMSLPALLPSP